MYALQVREWICQTAQGCEFDVPAATYDAHDFEVILSPQKPKPLAEIAAC